MYILLVCVLAPLVQNGLSLSGEEIDLKSLSNYETADDISDGLDIWDTAADESDAGFVVFDSISDELLEKICKDAKTLVYITEEDVTIDCKVFKNDGPVENKVVIKRDAEVEGSGDGGEEDKEEAPKQSEDNEPPVVAANEDSQKSQPETKEEAPKQSGDNEPLTVAGSEDSQTSQPETKEEAPEKFEESQSTVTASEESQTSQPETKEEVAPKPEENQPPQVPESKDETTTVQSSDQTVAEDDILPENPVEAQETTTPEPPETTQTSADEIIQSENEVINPEPPAVPKEDSPLEPRNEDKTETNQSESKQEQATEGFKPKSDDHDPKKDAEIIKGKTLLGHPNEETKVSANDVKTDESTQDTKQAGTKDTTILVFLFVAVLVVGAMAFGYNFIKKRKQRAADLERVERAPSTKRSLQDLVKADNEQEKKPLMGDKEVEMVDMKKENNTHEVTEKALSEETVKS